MSATPAASPRGTLRLLEPMSRRTSWRAGGTARRCYVPADSDDLAVFLAAQPPGDQLYVVGLGSNLLVRDRGLDATVVLTHGALTDLAVTQRDGRGALLDVEAGVAAPKVAKFAAREGLSGAEFLAGIPGTMGGALAMNAGCYGSQTWDHVVAVTTLDRAGGRRVRSAAEFLVSYRHVALTPMAQAQSGARAGCRPLEPLQEWFVSARLRFPPGDPQRAADRIRALLQRRIDTQPLGQPNAGSVFRNPEGDHAARLIDSCGLKGLSIGGAQVSAKHANFIVNTGGARAADIETLMAEVQHRVLTQTGIALVPEVRIIGERSGNGSIDPRGEPWRS